MRLYPNRNEFQTNSIDAIRTSRDNKYGTLPYEKEDGSRTRNVIGRLLTDFIIVLKQKILQINDL